MAALSCPERVVVLHDFSAVRGGASHLVRVLIGELRQRGIPVTFFAGDDGAAFPWDDVELVPLHGRALLERSAAGAFLGGLYNRRAAAAVAQWIARHDTPGTVYHLHGWAQVLSPAVFGPLRRVRERLVLHAHDYFNACPNGAFFDYRGGRACELVPLTGGCLARRCDKAGYPHKLWRSGREALRRRLHGGLGEEARMLLIHPGQAPALIAAGWPEDRLHAVRNPVTPPCDGRVRAEANRGVLFIGRISREKGADLAARAALAAGLDLTLVGDGSEAAAVRAIHPRVRLLGRQDRAGIARALSQARVAVMPSRWSEPFGLVALEAAGSGVPVVVSRHALIAGEVVRAGFGLAVDTTDMAAFAAALIRLDRDDALTAAMSRAGYQGYRALCTDPVEWADAVVAHYRAVLGAGVQQEACA